MLDLCVVAAPDGRWLLMDEVEGELGTYDSRADALRAASDFAVIDREPRHVLICDDGEWDETVVAPTALH